MKYLKIIRPNLVAPDIRIKTAAPVGLLRRAERSGPIGGAGTHTASQQFTSPDTL